MNIGTSSVLSAFVILCLVTFSALAFLSASTDNLLSKQAAAKTKEYYNTCAEADEHLSSLEKELKQMAADSKDEADFYKTVSGKYGADHFYDYHEEDDEKQIGFMLSVNERQNLHVVIDLNYPKEGNRSVFNINTYKVEANPGWHDTSDDDNANRLMTFD